MPRERPGPRRPALWIAWMAAAAAFGPIATHLLAQERDAPSAAGTQPAAPLSEDDPTGPADPVREAAPPPILSGGAGACQTLYEEIRAILDGVPANLSALGKAGADELAVRVDEMVSKTQRYQDECLAADSAQLAEVRFARAKGLFLLSERYKREQLNDVRASPAPDVLSALQDRMRAYHGDIQVVARSAFDGLPPGHPWKPRALQYIGQAASEAGEHEQALDAYTRLAELFPTSPEMDRFLLGQAKENHELQRHDVAASIAERVVREYPDRDSLGTAMEQLWKAHHAQGDLDALWEDVRRAAEAYPSRIASPATSDSARKHARLLLGFNGFRKGYVLCARGDLAAAEQAFREHVASMQSSDDQNPAAQVYMGRSLDYLSFLEKVAGKPAPAELQLEWVGEDRLALAACRGKAVAVVFRGVGDERSKGFLAPLWKLAMESPAIEMAVVSYQRSGENIQKQLDAMRDELGSVGYEGPAGLDPDGKTKAIFRAWHANVGSATFFIVDPDGTVSWFQQDPRPVDADFAKGLLRKSATKSPGSAGGGLRTIIIAAVAAAVVGLIVVVGLVRRSR